MFSIEKLKVYDKALSTVAELTRLSTGWDKHHAVVDQLVRASESVVLNIAEGARFEAQPIGNTSWIMPSDLPWNAPAVWTLRPLNALSRLNQH